MASFNVSLDDSSPLISYTPAGAWDDTPSGNPLLAQYIGRSLHSTPIKNASAIFKFNGTGVWFFGGNMLNYGTFSLTVDGNIVGGGASINSTPASRKLLVGTGGLPMGEHTAIFTNTGTGEVDIDSIMFETRSGTTNGTVSNSVIKDGSSDILYSGADWFEASGAAFTSNTTHFTGTNNASASLQFSGDAIAIYGGSSFNHGNYTVSLDGGKYEFSGGSNGQVNHYHPQTLLFFASDLANGPHNLTITNKVVGSATFLDIDQITVYKSPSYSAEIPLVGAHSRFHIHQASVEHVQTSRGLSKPALTAIIAISVLVAVAAALVAVFFTMRRKKREHARKVVKNLIGSPRPSHDLEKGTLSVAPSAPPIPPNGGFVGLRESKGKGKAVDEAEYGNSFVAFPSKPGTSFRDSGETFVSDGSATRQLPLPEFRMSAPTPDIPVLGPRHGRSESVSSVSTDGRRESVYDGDQDDFASYYRHSVNEGQYHEHYQHEMPTPSRPPRPLGLDLNDPEFHSVNL